MKRLAMPLLVIFAIVAASFFPFVAAVANDKTCIFKADANKVHVTVWDEDSEQDRQGRIFEGWIESNEEKKIKSTTGFIVFSYKLADDDRSYGDNHETCEGGNTIRVP